MIIQMIKIKIPIIDFDPKGDSIDIQFDTALNNALKAAMPTGYTLAENIISKWPEDKEGYKYVPIKSKLAAYSLHYYFNKCKELEKYIEHIQKVINDTKMQLTISDSTEDIETILKEIN